MLRLLSRRILLANSSAIRTANYSKNCGRTNVAVVLSGCGVYDGSEIHEAVSVLSHLTRNDASPFVFAPRIDQMHIINHSNGDEDKSSKRNVLVESARISRGDVKPLSELVENYKNFDAVVFPGGFGVAKNLSDFAVNGPKCTVHPDVVSILENCHKSRIMLGFACIAPVLAARVLCNVTITLGKESPAEDWPHKGAIEAAKSMGAIIELKEVFEVSADRENNVFSTPAYMYNGKYHEIDDGIGNMIRLMLVTLRQS
ncbi:ES1 protein homolog, mitochondrial-like [Nesidiocoris tenuis]|uniref:ES1 protein homolog, mitochondrial-like n=1 Tax=Nesidiocoris tenuis TaxID=355587 RepID=A0ABN7B696_9HEMI|nr:ES1 protein homolog, mitochondrial-like [Nesidiocoris tenuis]